LGNGVTKMKTQIGAAALGLILAAVSSSTWAQVNCGTGIDNSTSQPDLGQIEEPPKKSNSSPVTLSARSERPAPGLSQIGMMQCDGRLADRSDRLGRLELDCQFNRQATASESPVERARFSGDLIGTRTPVGVGEDTTLIFTVFSTQFDVPIDRLGGDYDRKTTRNFDFGDTQLPYLFGGDQDTVVLKPRGRAADAITPSTSITFTREISYDQTQPWREQK
jgi:hypothetical protein